MQKTGHCFIYCGDGKGKTTQAIGQGIRAIGEGLTVIFIQFLDYKESKEFDMLRSLELEPELKIFSFEKSRESLEFLGEADKKEIRNEILNAFNFSKKILETGECDVLILDGIINAVEHGFMNENELCEVIEKRSDNMDLILTGERFIDKACKMADAVYEIKTYKKLEE